MVGIPELDNVPNLDRIDYSNICWLYTVPSTGKFIYRQTANGKIGVANGVGGGHTCLGNFYSTMTDEERASLLPYYKTIVELMDRYGAY